jgi:PAS domain S-box-containing protein
MISTDTPGLFGFNHTKIRFYQCQNFFICLSCLYKNALIKTSGGLAKPRGRIPMQRIVKTLLLVAAMLIAAAVLHPVSAGASPKKQVLILNSYHKGLSWTDNVVAGIESVLKTDSEGRNVELHYEYMDTKRYYGEAYFRKLAETFAEKYRAEHFDLVIVSDNDAFDFAGTYGRKLFPGAPVVFCGVNNYKDSMLAGRDNFTGVAEDTDIRSTIAVALKLHPKAKQVVVLGDKTTTGLAMKQNMLEVIPEFQDRVKFVFFEDFDFPELQAKVRAVPPDSIILLSVVNRDRKGNFFAYEEGLDFIYPAAKAPIYSFWDFYLGRGIVGGMLTSGVQQGKTAGHMALRILRGESVSAIPVIKKSPNLYMFDERELRRFGVDPASLPAESIVINKPDTFYYRYRNLILAGSGIIITLSLVIVSLLVNISLRKRYETALRESEEKYRDLYDHAPDMYHSINRDGIIIDCNDTEAMMLGYAKEEIIGRPIADFLTEESRKTYDREFSTLTEYRALYGLDREFVRKDGTTFTASLNVFIEVDEAGELVRTKTIARDVTERKRVETGLLRSREELRSLSAHIQSAREEERGNIAREIHDELGQVLSKLKLDLSWLKKRLVPEQKPLLEKTDKMSDLVDSTIKTVQRISSELRPGVLDYLGLAEAIEWQLKEFRERTGMACTARISPELAVEDKDVSTTVFRILQETLTNIIRHAKASRVEVELKNEDNSLTLEIRDNGEGIAREDISDPASFGIMSMRERARHLGGAVLITGEPGKGTTVLVRIPLDGRGKT